MTLKRQFFKQKRKFYHFITGGNKSMMAMSEDRNFKIDHSEKVIYLSSIFDWYEKYFTNWYTAKFPEREASLLSYIELYLRPEKKEELKKFGNGYSLRFVPYDWRLNDQKS